MGQSSANVFERISAEYYNLTAAEKKAADYVLSHQRKTQDMSITELAAASGVAEATVSRFCRRLGCKGYNAFRLAIANSIALERADKVLCMGQGGSMIIAMEAAHLFSTASGSPDGAELKRAFIRAAQKRNIRQLRAGGIGKVRDKDSAQSALPRVGQRLNKFLCRA